MYLNLYQKYILGLLREYDGLLKRQLEFMTKRFVEPHLLNIDRFVEQLNRFGKVCCGEYMGNETVALPGKTVAPDIITAVDIMLKFSEYVISHQKGKSPIALRFLINTDEQSMREINILPVNQGEERNAAEYAETYVTKINDGACGRLPSWIFLVRNKEQMKLIRPDVEYSFAVAEKGEIVFYEDG